LHLVCFLFYTESPAEVGGTPSRILRLQDVHEGSRSLTPTHRARPRPLHTHPEVAIDKAIAPEPFVAAAMHCLPCKRQPKDFLQEGPPHKVLACQLPKGLQPRPLPRPFPRARCMPAGTLEVAAMRRRGTICRRRRMYILISSGSASRQARTCWPAACSPYLPRFAPPARADSGLSRMPPVRVAIRYPGPEHTQNGREGSLYALPRPRSVATDLAGNPENNALGLATKHHEREEIRRAHGKMKPRMPESAPFRGPSLSASAWVMFSATNPRPKNCNLKAWAGPTTSRSGFILPKPDLTLNPCQPRERGGEARASKLSSRIPANHTFSPAQLGSVRLLNPPGLEGFHRGWGHRRRECDIQPFLG
jgi:hypothetical protein